MLPNGTLAEGADFSNAKLGDYFDKTVPFVGAFGATDWTDGWVNFNPINTDYSQN